MSIDREDAVQSRSGAWHQSKLETLLDGCSWQYFLQYELDVPSEDKPSALIGVAYHGALELHENARMSGARLPSLDDLLDLASEKTGGDPELATPAHAALRNWWGTPMKDGGMPHREWVSQLEPVAIEPYFRISLVDGAKPIGGWIDAVYRNEGGEFLLVDHKTAESFSRWGYNGDEHRYQAAMYAVALALSPDFPDIEDLIPMTYMISRKKIGKTKTFEGARRVTVTPDLNDVKILGERIRAAEAKVAAEDYARRPDWVLCSQQWCPYYDRCIGTDELAGTPASVRVKLGVSKNGDMSAQLTSTSRSKS
jgi:hypothetical protein